MDVNKYIKIKEISRFYRAREGQVMYREHSSLLSSRKHTRTHTHTHTRASDPYTEMD